MSRMSRDCLTQLFSRYTKLPKRNRALVPVIGDVCVFSVYCTYHNYAQKFSRWRYKWRIHVVEEDNVIRLMKHFHRSVKYCKRSVYNHWFVFSWILELYINSYRYGFDVRWREVRSCTEAKYFKENSDRTGRWWEVNALGITVAIRNTLVYRDCIPSICNQGYVTSAFPDVLNREAPFLCLSTFKPPCSR